MNTLTEKTTRKDSRQFVKKFQNFASFFLSPEVRHEELNKMKDQFKLNKKKFGIRTAKCIMLRDTFVLASKFLLKAERVIKVLVGGVGFVLGYVIKLFL